MRSKQSSSSFPFGRTNTRRMAILMHAGAVPRYLLYPPLHPVI